jgi:hypothetical protein
MLYDEPTIAGRNFLHVYDAFGEAYASTIFFDDLEYLLPLIKAPNEDLE